MILSLDGNTLLYDHGLDDYIMDVEAVPDSVVQLIETDEDEMLVLETLPKRLRARTVESVGLLSMASFQEQDVMYMEWSGKNLWFDKQLFKVILELRFLCDLDSWLGTNCHSSNLIETCIYAYI